MTQIGSYVGSVLGEGKLRKDPQTATADGVPLFRLIDGVRERRAQTHIDQRGTLCEMFNVAWDFDEEPLTYVYQISILPGYVKGWVMHKEQADRLFFSTGRVRVILFDGREGSPTAQVLNQFEVGEMNRCLLRIPKGVYHALHNVGSTEAFMINSPTRPYRHDNPDKYRLPLNNDLIPYRFEDPRGW